MENEIMNYNEIEFVEAEENTGKGKGIAVLVAGGVALAVAAGVKLFKTARAKYLAKKEFHPAENFVEEQDEDEAK